MNLLQIYINRKATAHNVAWCTTVEKAVDYLIIAEPNKRVISTGNWLVDTEEDIAIKNVTNH